MSGGLKVGDVFVAVSASLGDFSKSMDKLLSDVEKVADGVAKAMQEAADAVGGFSENLLAVSALAGAAVLGAAEHCEEAKKATDKLKDSMSQLSVDVGRSFLPLVRELTQVVRTLTATWRGLSADAKDTIVAFVRQAAIFGAVGMAMSRTLLVGKSLAEGVVVLTRVTRAVGPVMVESLAGIARSAGAALTTFNAFMRMSIGSHFQAISTSLARMRSEMPTLSAFASEARAAFGRIGSSIVAIAGPVLAVAAAIAALVLLAGSIYGAWKESSTGLRDSVLSIWKSIGEMAAKVKDVFLGVFDSFMEFIKSLASVVLEMVAQKVRDVARFAELIAHKLKNEKWEANLRQVQDLTGSGLVNAALDMAAPAINKARAGLAKAGEGLLEMGRAAGEAVAYGVEKSVDGVKALGRDSGLAAEVDRIFDLFAGATPRLGDPSTVEDPDFEKKERHLDKEPQRVGGDDDFLEKYKKQIQAWGKDAVRIVRGDIATAIHVEIADTYNKEVALALRAYARATREATVQALREEFGGRLRAAVAPAVSIVETFVNGLTASGGNLLVGLGSVLTDMIMKSEGFSTLMGMVTNLFQRAADILGAVLTPLQGLLGAVSLLLDAAIRPLVPLFSIVANLLQPLVPVLVMVGEVFNALSPLLEMFAQLVNLVLTPLRLLGGVVMKGLFTVLKGVAWVIMGIVVGLGTVWNGIIGAIQSVFRTIGEISIFGGHPFEFLSDWADELEGAKAPVDEVKQAMGELADMTTDMAEAKANERAETLKNTQALRSATEALSNVPSAWRSAKAKWMAQDPQQGGPVPAGGGTGGLSSTPSQGGGGKVPQQQGPTVNQSFTFELVGSVTDMAEQAARAQKEALARLGRSGVSLLLPIIPVGGR
jgi:hypothetical protein